MQFEGQGFQLQSPTKSLQPLEEEQLNFTLFYFENLGLQSRQGSGRASAWSTCLFWLLNFQDTFSDHLIAARPHPPLPPGDTAYWAVSNHRRCLRRLHRPSPIAGDRPAAAGRFAPLAGNFVDLSAEVSNLPERSTRVEPFYFAQYQILTCSGCLLSALYFNPIQHLLRGDRAHGSFSRRLNAIDAHFT